jgi:hypothetical protein
MIAIGMKRRALAEKEMPEWEEMCAVACAVQNLWLAATARGLAGARCRCSPWALALGFFPCCSRVVSATPGFLCHS